MWHMRFFMGNAYAYYLKYLYMDGFFNSWSCSYDLYNDSVDFSNDSFQFARNRRYSLPSSFIISA